MKKSSILQALGFIPLLLVVCLKTAEACSCGPAPNVLDSFDTAGNVVIVKAVAVQKAGGKFKNDNTFRGIKSTVLSVEKIYKGQLKPGDEVTFAQGGGADCIWTFDNKSIGRRYLFYLDEGDKNRKSWVGFGCGRSGLVENVAEDLLYLDNLEKVRGKTRISGTIKFTDYSSVPDTPRAEGKEIKIVGNGRTYNLKTDKNGVYEIYDLPAGKYQIIPETVKGWKFYAFYLSYSKDLTGSEDKVDNETEESQKVIVKLADKKHAAVNFYFGIDNVLRGKLYDPDGSLMDGVCIRLYPPSGVTLDFPHYAGCTKKNGSFEIDEVPPGSYILVANETGKITSSEPFKTVYYPGVFELDKAAVINIGVADSREELNIRIPRMEELVTIQGALLYSDGKPVESEDVVFKSDNDQRQQNGDARTKTDSQGRFTLKLLKGTKGKLFGSIYTYLGDFQNCPKLDALIKSSGDTFFDAKTPKLQIVADDNIFDVQVKFSFPSCQRQFK